MRRTPASLAGVDQFARGKAITRACILTSNTYALKRYARVNRVSIRYLTGRLAATTATVRLRARAGLKQCRPLSHRRSVFLGHSESYGFILAYLRLGKVKRSKPDKTRDDMGSSLAHHDFLPRLDDSFFPEHGNSGQQSTRIIVLRCVEDF